MPAPPVILNNTPLVALWSLDQLTLLRDLYQSVLIPPAVEAEFLAIDRVARHLGLPLTGTLGILLLAKEKGLVTAVGPLIERLQASGLYLATELVERVLILAQERDPS